MYIIELISAMSKQKIEKPIKLNIDHKLAANKFILFQTEQQRLQAREQFEDYLVHIMTEDPVYASELVRRMNSDKDFNERMLLSSLQLSCLIISTLIESILVYDYVFPAVKEYTIKDYDEIKAFKRYIINQFSIKELQENMGFILDKDTLEQFEKKFKEIKTYFFNY